MVQNPSDLQFSIGSFDFKQEDAFVMPNGMQGGLSDLGGIQAYVATDFPGGMRVVQLFGPFPTMIEFQGIFFGADALDRANVLDKIRTDSQQVTLTYGVKKFDGALIKFKITANNQNDVRYDLGFVPVKDKSASNGFSSGSGTQPSGTLAAAQNAAQFQSQTPAANYTFPSTIQNGVTNLNQSFNQALNQAGGQIGNLTSDQVASLQTQTQDLVDQLQTLVGGTDANAASAASDLSSSLQIMSSSLTFGSNPTTVLSTSNPNLLSLAAQYYGNPMKWTLIAAANPILQNDPMPIGDFDLTIPQDDAPEPLTVPPTIV
jgi:hypothetical protein